MHLDHKYHMIMLLKNDFIKDHQYEVDDVCRYELPGIIELSVEPIKGRIQPDSLQTFRLIVVTGGKPCSFQADVNCVFINQTEKRAYEKKIFLHNSLCDEMKDYFIITEKGTSIPVSYFNCARHSFELGINRLINTRCPLET